MKIAAFIRKNALPIVGVGVAAIAILATPALLTKRSTGEWEKVQAELAAKGEILLWDAFIPEPVPDSENIYATPVFERLIGLRRAGVGKTIGPNPTNEVWVRPSFPPAFNAAPPYPMAYLEALPKNGPENTENFEDLDRWLARWDADFTELNQALKLPRAYPIGDYSFPETAPFANFVELRNIALILATRARIHFLKGERAAGMEDLRSLRGLIRALDTKPSILINAMIGGTTAFIYSSAIHDITARRLATEAELTEIAGDCATVNLLRMTQSAMREGERAGMGRHMEQLVSMKRTAKVADLFPSSGFQMNLMLRFAPAGWVRKNLATHALIVQEFIETLDPVNLRFDPAKSQAAVKSMSETFGRWSHDTAIAEIVTPRFEKAIEVAAMNQTALAHARIACALELHRLKHGAYPDALDTLTPTFIEKLPHDLVTGGAFIYKRDGDSVKLYSVGPNARDDGGTSEPGAKLDWTWGK